MAYCRGKKPARAGAISLRLGDFIDESKLPPLPDTFGHSLGVLPGMYGNDEVGDCVLAGAANETNLWFAEADRPQPNFSAAGIKKQYFDLTGGADDGLDVAATAKWRRDVGLFDDDGKQHKIEAYLALQPGNINHLFYGVYLFGAVGIGWRLPDIADEQFDANTAWDFIGQQPGDGHYTPLVGRRPGVLHIFTWGKRYPVLETSLTPTFCDEAVAYVSREGLVNQKSPEGFDYAGLTGFLEQLA